MAQSVLEFSVLLQEQANCEIWSWVHLKSLRIWAITMLQFPKGLSEQKGASAVGENHIRPIIEVILPIWFPYFFGIHTKYIKNLKTLSSRKNIFFFFL